ncbi:MAG: bifunctional hydroxymethylpyrimidine kinase/phosphomethylpyrimidine kinase [Planctomycetota bacterium]
MMEKPPLTIAGSDPTGGAGLEADLKVFLAHGLSGAALATALTVQDTHRVHDCGGMSPGLFRRRLEVLAADISPGGIKTGLLPGPGIVRALAEHFERDRPRLLVIDPVLAPTRGKPFLSGAGRRLLLDRLLPLATLVTPNLGEAALLLGRTEQSVRRAPEKATRQLLETGVGAVLLKGGHFQGGMATDLMDDGRRITELSLPRIGGRAGKVHGTGCALSAALLSNLLLGHSLEEAARRAKRYVHEALRGARRVGGGRLQLGFLADRAAGS